MLKARDLEYIESRLIVPCTPAMQAHERLMDIGELEFADDLMDAMQEFTTSCRNIRQRINDAQTRTP